MVHDETALMRMATRAAARGIGHVEPNPAVGCVIATPRGEVLAIGHHRRFGGAHAEIDALARCRVLGRDPRGAMMVVTLEPCNHHGKTGPCSEAVIAAGIGRVVFAARDPNPPASGGAERLGGAGIAVSQLTTVADAFDLSAPFRKRIATGLPWVIAKWAQTLDGRIASRTGGSQWISGPAARRAVHRTRGRVDAILTGIGTVVRDDPRLTVREARIRRTARRVIADSDLRTPVTAAILRDVADVPVTIATTTGALSRHADRGAALRAAGAEVVGYPGGASGRVDLAAVLRDLVDRHDVSRVLVEAGAGMVSALMGADLVDETHTYIAPMILGDAQAMPAVDFGVPRELADATRFELRAVKRYGDDVRLRCVRTGRAG